jgi:hypothetical protein
MKKVHPFGFFFPGGRFQADTNSNLECLRRILEFIGVGHLPKKLYIQMDNTCKDNKNYKFLLFCAFLLFARYVFEHVIILILFDYRHFSVIEIYFLPVGHTHGQIDQMFSNFSQFLKKWPAKTLLELCFSLKESYNNRNKRKAKKQAMSSEDKRDTEVNIQVIDNVVDVVSWLQSMEIKGSRSHLTLRDSHAFQLQLDTSGNHVIVRSKQYAVLKEWLVRYLLSFSFMLYYVAKGWYIDVRSSIVYGWNSTFYTSSSIPN